MYFFNVVAPQWGLPRLQLDRWKVTGLLSKWPFKIEDRLRGSA